jgi:hypothetical protein
MKQVIVSVLPDGSYTVEAVGIEGKGCIKETRQVEELLGESGDRTLKSSYHAQPREVEVNLYQQQ